MKEEPSGRRNWILAMVLKKSEERIKFEQHMHIHMHIRLFTELLEAIVKQRLVLLNGKPLFRATAWNFVLYTYELVMFSICIILTFNNSS